MERKQINEIIGWYGTFAVVIAYALVTFNMLDPKDMTYLLLNASGSIGIAFISIKKKAYQPAVLNIIWMLIAFIGIISIYWL